MRLIKNVGIVVAELLLPRRNVGVTNNKHVVCAKHRNLFAVGDRLNDEVGEELVVFLLPVQDKTWWAHNDSRINGTRVIVAILRMDVIKSCHRLNRLA